MNENQLAEYKVTQKFLRFLCKVFKHSNPMLCLEKPPTQMGMQQEERQVVRLEYSFLMQALEYVYMPLMQHYFRLKFVDAYSLGSLTARLLKLTRILLNKFTDVPVSQKAVLHEPFKHFDMFLHKVVRVLNDVPIQKICIAALNLTEVDPKLSQVPSGKQGASHLENKFVSEALSHGQGSERQTLKLRTMVTEALENLVLML